MSTESPQPVTHAAAVCIFATSRSICIPAASKCSFFDFLMRFYIYSHVEGSHTPRSYGTLAPMYGLNYSISHVEHTCLSLNRPITVQICIKLVGMLLGFQMCWLIAAVLKGISMCSGSCTQTQAFTKRKHMNLFHFGTHLIHFVLSCN
jgi:hypothetical protein